MDEKVTRSETKEIKLLPGPHAKYKTWPSLIDRKAITSERQRNGFFSRLQMNKSIFFKCLCEELNMAANSKVFEWNTVMHVHTQHPDTRTVTNCTKKHNI